MGSNLNRRKFILSTLAASIGITAIGVTGHGITVQTDYLPDNLLIDSKGKSIKNKRQWQANREVIKRNWLQYLGAIPSNPAIPGLTILKEDYPEGMVRQLVEYEGEPGIRVKAYLLFPPSTKPLPAVVAMHSTSDNQMLYISGVEKGKIVPLGYNLAKMGYVVICPQCFLWHDRINQSGEEMTSLFQKRHPQSKGMAKMLFDAQRAVDVLESLSQVDKKRIGAIGHSLGAKEVLYLGAFDDRVKVIVSNEGGIGIDFSNWDAVWYLGAEIKTFGRQHHEILALAAPKPFLLIGGDSADGRMSVPYIDAVKPVYALYDKQNHLELFNHGRGHSISPDAEKKSYEWIKRYL